MHHVHQSADAITAFVISYIPNEKARSGDGRTAATSPFSRAKAAAVRSFHAALPDYKPTPLVQLHRLARAIGVTSVAVKDESSRFGLGAFKVLGASHGAAHALSPYCPTPSVSFEALAAQDLRRVMLVTATDGNHGRALAWAAERLGCSATVYLPARSAVATAERIHAFGAEVCVTDGNYDDAVRLAAAAADRNGWLLVQDTAWPGYEERPLRIMQGYLTLIDEALEQLEGAIPTHILLQCGAGSFAAALQAYVCELWGLERPFVAVVESSQAACFLASMQAGGEARRTIPGEHKTIMAGLACGEPSMLAWEILRAHADLFVACDDIVAVEGMSILRDPMAGDEAIDSGPSGAVTAGVLAAVRRSPAAAEGMHLDLASRVLLISTEGGAA